MPELRDVATRLEEEGISDVWADCWIACPVTFYADGHVIAAPSSIVDRLPRLSRRVRMSRQQAWLAVSRSEQDPALRRELGLVGCDYFRMFLTSYTVYVCRTPADTDSPSADAKNDLRLRDLPPAWRELAE